MKASVVCAVLLLLISGEAIGAYVGSANQIMQGCRFDHCPE
jgi:hypothetical protein